MVSQKEILTKVRDKVRQAFKDIHFWVHDFDHTKRVVNYGQRIVKEEGPDLLRRARQFSPLHKFAFLVELACWLHDLGRTVEKKPSFWGEKFNHALESERLARKMLGQILPPVATDADLELVYQAIAEHNHPTPAHPNNLITRFLQDADRGEGFGFRGIILVLNYNRVINMGKKLGERECQQAFLENLPQLLNNGKKRKQVVHWLTFFSTWYTGGPALKKGVKDEFGKDQVCPLYTQTAKRIYYKKYLIVKKYLEMFKRVEERGTNKNR